MAISSHFRRRVTALAGSIVVIALVLSTGCQLSPVTQPATPSSSKVSATSPTASPSPAETSSPAPSLSAGDFSAAVRQVVERVKPAVVQITNEQVQIDQFNQPFTVPAGVGSGVIYDSQGHILTNDHVVEGADRLLVSLPDGRSFPGKIVGQDPQTDLAVVQISDSNLPIAQLGDSGKLQVGDWVVAIGNALALQGGPTVTAGVVSALKRTVQEPGDSRGGGGGPFLFDVIQTDAPINPGNSGGPLVNLAGQVVGINTLVAGQAETGVQAQGIGFAIAISTAKPIADQLVSAGRVVHPYLGISYAPLNPAISAQLGTSEKNGVLVASVAAGSPAAKAGLRRRDIITEVDGTAIQSDSGLAQVLNQHKPGDTITLTVLRGTQKLSVKVTLGEMPS